MVGNAPERPQPDAYGCLVAERRFRQAHRPPARRAPKPVALCESMSAWLSRQRCCRVQRRNAVSKGTDAGLLLRQQPQSVFKHAILDQHAIRFCTMTASKLVPKRAVVVDAFAGRGRFPNGQPGSAEQLLKHALRVKGTTAIDVFLIEKNKADFAVLDAVAAEYRAHEILVETRRGDCGDFLAEAEDLAAEASLFLFIDPCGALLPFDDLKQLLTRRGDWPRTEVLMNFSADLIRRAGGQYKKGQLDLGGVAAADTVCGGEWWREVALQAHLDSGGDGWESAAWAVADEYARRLAGDRSWVVAPVRREPHHQPVYFLIFVTSSNYGLWVFGNAASIAREKWLEALGPDADAETGMLFPMETVAHQIATERDRALTVIKANLRRLVEDGQAKKIVDHVLAVFGEAYGEAHERTFNAAVRELLKAGEIELVEKAKSPYNHVIRRYGSAN